MKISTVILAMLLPLTASAQNYQGMSEQDMQNMMQQMQKMQTCMQDIDQSRLQALEQRATAVEAEVKSLCTSGKRDAAQQEAIAFSREIMSDPDIRKMRKCTENMKDMMPRMPYMDQASKPDTAASHVCDQ
jgi:DNA-binding transcriptional regulator YbjK